MKKLLIIQAGWEQLPLIKTAKQLGLYVITTDSYESAPGFQYADETFIVEPHNLIELDKIFLKVKPDGIISDECDYGMFAVAYLTSKYNLPGPNIDSLIITNNKYLQRRAAKEAKIKQPNFYLCLTFEEVKQAVNNLGLPVMLKPLDNRGSIGVCRVFKKSDLKEAYFDSLSNSYSRQIIVEEFVNGQVVIVDGIYAKKFINLSFSTKKMHPKFYDNAMFLRYPGDLKEDIVKKLYLLNKKIVKACGINYGITHTEFIVSDKEINFLEIANRGGGVGISNIIIPYVTGIDINEFLIFSSLGKKFNFKNKRKKSRFTILHFFDFGKGKVKEINNFKKVSKLKNVLALRLNFKKGDFLNDIKTAANRPGFVIVGADSFCECSKLINRINNTLKVKF